MTFHGDPHCHAASRPQSLGRPGWLSAWILTACLSAGCVGTKGEVNAQDAAPSRSSVFDMPDVLSIFASKKKNRSVERLVRTEDGRWYVEGAEDEAISKARTTYDAAVEHYRQQQYAKAARLFHTVAKAYKGSPIEEDALFMEAECYFQQERYPKAQDKYSELMTRYPTTRFMPQAVQRSYDIAYFWLEDSRLRSQGKPTRNYAVTNAINLFDKRRPLLDTEGRAIEAIESIQTAEPTGPLSDDALMMAGAHNFTNQNYIKSATYYEQLAIDMPKSEHAQKALILGAQSYLRAYDGPSYDGVDLENAYKLTQSALRRPDLPEDQRARLEADLRHIHLERAKRDFMSGEQYRRMRRPQGARYYYQLTMQKYPDTDWARRAKEELDKLPPESAAGSTSPASSGPGWLDRLRSSWTSRRQTSPVEAFEAQGTSGPGPAAGESQSTFEKAGQ